jgi:nucleoid-associated protein YgaU
MKPIQGQTYIVQNGDTLTKISSKAYGVDSNGQLIRDANQIVFATDNLNEVQPGEQLFIPFDPIIQQLKNDIKKL